LLSVGSARRPQKLDALVKANSIYYSLKMPRKSILASIFYDAEKQLDNYSLYFLSGKFPNVQILSQKFRKVCASDSKAWKIADKNYTYVLR
jgi:hypothetical protein